MLGTISVSGSDDLTNFAGVILSNSSFCSFVIRLLAIPRKSDIRASCSANLERLCKIGPKIEINFIE